MVSYKGNEYNLVYILQHRWKTKAKEISLRRTSLTGL